MRIILRYIRFCTFVFRLFTVSPTIYNMQEWKEHSFPGIQDSRIKKKKKCWSHCSQCELMYLNNSYKYLSLSSGSVVKMRSAPSKCYYYCLKKICYWKFCFQDIFMISEARDFENLFLLSLKRELQEPQSVDFLFSHNFIGCSTMSRTEMNKRVAVLVLLYRLK